MYVAFKLGQHRQITVVVSNLRVRFQPVFKRFNAANKTFSVDSIPGFGIQLHADRVMYAERRFRQVGCLDDGGIISKIVQRIIMVFVQKQARAQGQAGAVKNTVVPPIEPTAKLTQAFTPALEHIRLQVACPGIDQHRHDGGDGNGCSECAGDADSRDISKGGKHRGATAIEAEKPNTGGQAGEKQRNKITAQRIQHGVVP